MRKKIMAFLLLGIVAIGLTACGSKKEECKTEETKKETIDYKVLVNKENKLPDNWEKIVELDEDIDAWGDKVLVEKKALKKYRELKKALLEDETLEKMGIEIELDSIYRSVAEQQDLWDRWSKDPEKGPEYVKKYVAVPGYSEHHTGLAIDICLRKNGKIIADNDDMIKEKKVFAIIHEKLADYGFILRYPEGKDEITGYSYEPWHFRYIDDVDAAKEIMSKGLTYEEYLNQK